MQLALNIQMPIRVGFYDCFVTCAGSGSALLALLQRLDRQRIQPLAFFPHHGPLVDAVAALDVPVTIVPPPGLLRQYGKGALLGSLLKRLRVGLDVYRYSRQLADLLRAQRIDVLHCNQTRSILQAGLAARRAGIPTVWRIRIREPLPGWIVRWADRWSDCVLGVWYDVMDEFQGADRLRRKFEVVVEPIDSNEFRLDLDGAAIRDEFGLTPDDPLIVMVALLHPRKRHDLAIQVMPAILERFPAAKLLIVGEPVEHHCEYAESLRRMIDQLNLAEHVVLTGHREDVPLLLAATDVFVLPSEQEGFSVAVMEAMMSGTPVVATPEGGRALQDGINGLIVEEGDVEGLASAVLRLLQSPELRHAYGQAARQQALAQWSTHAPIRRCEELYERLAAGYRG